MAKTYIASLDSATQLLQALANFLHGKDVVSKSIIPKQLLQPFLLPFLYSLNTFPDDIRAQLLSNLGKIEAISPPELANVRAEQVAHHEINKYPKKQYQAIALGSSNGALTHIAAALHIPYLPQTYLILVKRKINPDYLTEDFTWGEKYGAALLKKNPKLALYQMHDPVNDRLMAQEMAYLRIKYRRLPMAYKQFIRQSLAPGGKIVIVECQKKWPVTKISDRHFFQTGGIGGTTIEEYLEGGKRVEQFLKEYKSPLKRFIVPKTDTVVPEAEWGFDKALEEEIIQFAKKNNYKIVRLKFNEPEDMSSLVADFYKEWYKSQNIPTNRLFIESFIQIEPYWTIRAGLIPLWMTFNGESSLKHSLSYLSKNTFDYIYLTAFNLLHGIGIPSAQKWKMILKKAKVDGKFLGIHEDKFPVDATTVINYYFDMRKSVESTFPLPAPLPLSQFENFIQTNNKKYPVQWMNE